MHCCDKWAVKYLFFFLFYCKKLHLPVGELEGALTLLCKRQSIPNESEENNAGVGLKGIFKFKKKTKTLHAANNEHELGFKRLRMPVKGGETLLKADNDAAQRF